MKNGCGEKCEATRKAHRDTYQISESYFLSLLFLPFLCFRKSPNQPHKTGKTKENSKSKKIAIYFSLSEWTCTNPPKHNFFFLSIYYKIIFLAQNLESLFILFLFFSLFFSTSILPTCLFHGENTTLLVFTFSCVHSFWSLLFYFLIADTITDLFPLSQFNFSWHCVSCAIDTTWATFSKCSGVTTRFSDFPGVPLFQGMY